MTLIKIVFRTSTQKKELRQPVLINADSLTDNNDYSIICVSTLRTCGREKTKGSHTDFHFTFFLFLPFSFFPSLSLFICISLHMSLFLFISPHFSLSRHFSLHFFSFLSRHFSHYLLSFLSLSLLFALSILRSLHLSSLLSHHYSLFLTLSSLPSYYPVMSLFFSQ